MRIFSFLIILLGLSSNVGYVTGGETQPNEHYPASDSVTCKGSFEDEEIRIQVKDGNAVLTVGPDTQYERHVVFQNVVGVRDAMGMSVYTSAGFALLVNRSTGKGTYMGAVGLGAWSVQELQQLSVDCEKEPA